MKRIILSGGGTGGHIYPAITIAREILKIEEAEILFIGTRMGWSLKLFRKRDLLCINSGFGIKRKITFDNIKILMQAIHSLFKAKAVLNKFKPDIVIGTGGYVCGPILMAAALSRIPTLIQEQNVIPGITNKILNRVVDKVALGYEEARIRFPKPEKCIYTGIRLGRM
ncbi:MAG: UDP-N-acetylglucosamine--N-acetylmuramyl-(pentapeptide) pyrophosphoryl-undecaprenol N-acetylglucosamine transferase [Dialister invisus]